MLRPNGVNEPPVLAATGELPRERSVPREHVTVACPDTIVLLGNGRELNAALGLDEMLCGAAPEGGEPTFVVGAATGYAAVVPSRLVGSVVTTEQDLELIDLPQQEHAGTHVKLVKTPLTKGYSEDGIYGLVLINGVVEIVPRPIVDHLVDGGRLTTIILDRKVSRISIGRRVGENFGILPTTDFATVPPSFRKPRTFSF